MSTSTSLIVATNRGVYSRASSESNFRRLRYSSDFCSYPWWSQVGNVAGAVGPKLFLAKAGQYGFHNYTTDWGKTFDIVKTSSTTKEFMGFAIREITPAGKKLLLNDSFGKFFIFDPSANTYEPFAGGASYEIPEKNMRITPLALTNNQLNGNIGVYQDIGLTNQIRFLAPNHLRAAHSAVSIGNVMVVGFQGGVIRDEGADLVTGGFGVYVDGKQVNFFRDSGSVFNLKRNVIYASGKIIAYSWRIRVKYMRSICSSRPCKSA